MIHHIFRAYANARQTWEKELENGLQVPSLIYGKDWPTP